MTRYLGGSPQDEASDTPDDTVSEISHDISEGIPQSALDIKELDPARGMEYCGDAEDYLFALQTYAESVEDKASQLEESLKEDRMDDYVLLIHSLKSMSKSIGAIIS